MCWNRVPQITVVWSEARGEWKRLCCLEGRGDSGGRTVWSPVGFVVDIVGRDGCGVPGMCEPIHPPVRAERLACAAWLSGVGGGRRSCLSSSLVVVSCTLFVASGVSLRGGRILSSVSHIAFRAVDSGMKVRKGLEPVMPCTRFTHARSFSRTTLWSSLFHE